MTQTTHKKYITLRIKKRGASILRYKVVTYRQLQRAYFLCSSSNHILYTNETFMQFCVTYLPVSSWWTRLRQHSENFVSILSLARSHVNTNLVRTAQLAKSTSPVSWRSHQVSWYSHCSLLTVPTARSRAGGSELKTSQMKYPLPLSHPSISSFSVYLHQE